MIAIPGAIGRPRVPVPRQKPTDPADALGRGRDIFSISIAQGKAESLAVGEFFRRYPSRAANQVTFFHTMWAQNHKFEDNPLRAYLYHETRPIDGQGRPKNALWKAYAEAVAAGMPASEVETRFLRAHIQEFKDVVQRPEYRKLYGLATDDYRAVVEAYHDALRQFEGDLAKGRDPEQIARWMSLDTAKWLARRKARNNGLEVTLAGVRNLLDPRQPATRQFWRSLLEIGTGVVFDARVDRPAPTAVVTDLSAAQARRLAAETGIPFQAGRHPLTEEMLTRASVAEPDRRPPGASGLLARAPLPRYKLLLSDFTAPQKLRPGLPMAGPDGVMTAGEILGVVRNVQARARSELVKRFFDKYPVPEAGILVYSANMLAMTGAYGQSQMFGTLANEIMPMDNEGKPKNALWQAYADAYDRHERDGHPSMEVLESLWFKAHMEDFKIVDTPAFRRQLAVFWSQASKDKAMEPMAIYTKAMVDGREVFEAAMREQVSDDVAFTRGFTHFAKTVATSGTFPFWQHDVAEAFAWFKNRKGPDRDSRGLPTDKALFERAVAGIRMMRGLTRVTSEGFEQRSEKTGTRRPAGGMVDLAKVLTPEQLRQVDPRVVAFYKDPRNFDVRVGVDFKNWLSKAILGKLDPFLACMGKIPDRVKGFENYPLEMDLYRDKDDRVNWDRFVVVDGRRMDLFPARFEVEGRHLVETFTVYGKPVKLVFDVEPHEGGIRLTLNRGKSSFVLDSRIVFTTKPTATGLRTEGEYTCSWGFVNGKVEFRMTPKSAGTAIGAAGALARRAS